VRKNRKCFFNVNIVAHVLRWL